MASEPQDLYAAHRLSSHPLSHLKPPRPSFAVCLLAIALSFKHSYSSSRLPHTNVYSTSISAASDTFVLYSVEFPAAAVYLVGSNEADFGAKRYGLLAITILSKFEVENARWLTTLRGVGRLYTCPCKRLSHLNPKCLIIALCALNNPRLNPHHHSRRDNHSSTSPAATSTYIPRDRKTPEERRNEILGTHHRSRCFTWLYTSPHAYLGLALCRPR